MKLMGVDDMYPTNRNQAIGKVMYAVNVIRPRTTSAVEPPPPNSRITESGYISDNNFSSRNSATAHSAVKNFREKIIKITRMSMVGTRIA